MSGTPNPARKRDKWKEKLQLGRSLSLIQTKAPSSNAQNAPMVQGLVPPASFSSPAAPIASSPSSSAVHSTVATIISPRNFTAYKLPVHTPPAPDIWSRALRTLPEDEQSAIRDMLPTHSPQQVLSQEIEELVSLTRTKQRACEEASYQFSFQGKNIILRDVAQKIVYWLNKFKDVGDVAVNFDPVHAALPWAGVRFLLQAAVGSHEQMGALLVSVEKVTCLVNRCTVYENLYKSGMPLQERVLLNFQAALTRLYATILRILTLAHRLLAQNIVKRTLHAVFSAGDLSNLLATCEELERAVDMEAQNCERVRSHESDTDARDLLERTLELLESLSKPILRTDDRVAHYLERVDTRERLKVLNWVSGVLYGKNHDSVAEQRTENTCEWLLKRKSYLEWKDTSSSMILWLHGTAGTGKTYLTSKVIDDIRSTLENNPHHEGLAYFYCNRNDPEREDPLNVLRSFVRQLSTIANNNCLMQKRLIQFSFQAQERAAEPTMEDCKGLLLEFINIYPNTTLILDALDECDKNKRGILIETLDYLLDNAQRPVKLFISSRPDGDIKDKFKSRMNIEIQATDNHGDISKFVKREIAKHRRWKKMSSELQTEIIQTLHDRSQGMFQWAFLQIKQLLDLLQEEDIRERLGKLPKDLKDAYDEIYNGMSEREKQVANRAFQWAMCSSVPLPTSTFLLAVCQDLDHDTIQPIGDLDEDILLEYCHNLLVIDSNRGVWVPSHLSVVEYFEQQHWSQNQANCLVAGVCLIQLNDVTSMPRTIREMEEAKSLDSYAALHWINHVQKCDAEETDARLSARLKLFLGSPTQSSPAYQLWHKCLIHQRAAIPLRFYSSSNGGNGRSYILRGDLEPVSSASFAICAFGFYHVLSDWWATPWKGKSRKSAEGASLLQLGAMVGSVPICTRLIEWGAKVDEQLADESYGSALAAAANFSRGDVVELLLKSGANVNKQLRAGEFGSALISGTWGGDLGVVRLLLGHGAMVNMQVETGTFGTALIAAVLRGNIEMVQLLLESGADVNTQARVGYDGSPLIGSVNSRAKPQLVQLLLDSGADVNLQVRVGRFGNALMAALHNASFEVIKMVLEAGADVHAQLQIGPRNIMWAVHQNIRLQKDKRIRELLLKYGATLHIG